MIRGFEKHTHDITPEERNKIIPLLVKGLTSKIGKDKAMTSKKIIEGMKMRGHALTGSRLRKMINYIRINKLVKNLVSNSNGYYIATNRNEVEKYVLSLNERANAIKAVARSFQNTQT